jgi:hypothetical protein
MRTRTALFIALALCSAAAMAFVEDKRKLTPVPERSQDTVAREQEAYGGAYGRSGEVKEDDDGAPDDYTGSDYEAQGDFDVAAQIQAKKSMDSAAGRKKEAEEKGGFPWWAVVFGMAGVGVVFAARQYANKHVPDPQASGRF